MPDPVMTALQAVHAPQTETDLENWFTYHAPVGDQAERYTRIRAAALEFARIVCTECPQSADRTVAVRTIREAVFWANASIACNERGR